jgi:signal transduction histidine kinase
MKSLLIRFFLSFWLIIGLTIGVAAIGGYWYAERVRDAYDNFELGDSILEASAALKSAGREGLTAWLRELPETQGLRVLVLDGRGKDLLSRPVPVPMRRMLDRKRRFMMPPDHSRHDPENLMRARPLSQLIGPNGQHYIFVVVPVRNGVLVEYGLSAPTLLLILALMVSAAVSLMLARTMSRPVRELREATRSLAEGDFEKRVSESVGRRKDELGQLARDFDLMANNLQRSAAQQLELSRNVSHELRSPLARLRVALEIARREAGDLAEFDRIDTETERLDNLIAQILNYTRLDSLAEQDKRMISLNDIIADVIADVNYECNSAGIDDVSIRPEFSSSIDILVHEQSVRSAIENILRNAVRHTNSSSQVVVTLRREYPSTAIITFDDCGPGVPDDDLDRLFEPFFRSRQTANDNEGTGLGLAIAARAVTLHGGTIAASNRASGGLRITIELPC